MKGQINLSRLMAKAMKTNVIGRAYPVFMGIMMK
jgi:hypothetical protein